jgi:hypothetical protein
MSARRAARRSLTLATWLCTCAPIRGRRHMPARRAAGRSRSPATCQTRGGGNLVSVSVFLAKNDVSFRGLAGNQKNNGGNGNREILISPLTGSPVLGRYQVGITDPKTVSSKTKLFERSLERLTRKPPLYSVPPYRGTSLIRKFRPVGPYHVQGYLAHKKPPCPRTLR